MFDLVYNSIKLITFKRIGADCGYWPEEDNMCIGEAHNAADEACE